MTKLVLFLLLFTIRVVGQSIIPHPAVQERERGTFTIRPGLRVWASAACADERRLLEQYWREMGFSGLITASKPRAADILLVMDTSRREAVGPEGYELLVSPRRISITGATAAGVFYGLQTLRQLLPPLEIPDMEALRVRDKPRFGWRSFLLIENRQTLGLEALKKLVDQLALLKFNRLRWVLPSSKSAKAVAYSANEIEQIRQYGRERHIHVDSQPVLQSTVRIWESGNTAELLKLIRAGQEVVVSTASETHLHTPISELPLERIYRFEPLPDQLPEDLRPLILGVGYEYRVETANGKKEFTDLYPRLAAAAEVGWTFAHLKDISRFKMGLPTVGKYWTKK